MKRFLFCIVLMGFLVLFMEPAGNLLSNLLRLDQPMTHQIQEGDWLSKIAERNYGDASYWKELALINRAPDGDMIFPGEEVIVPSFEAIRKVRESRRLSAVNDIVEMQQDILAGRMQVEREPLADAQQQPQQKPEPVTERPSAAQSEQSPEEETAAPDLAEHYGTNGSQDTPFYRSTLFITGVVILGVILAIGIFLYYRQKKREDVNFYGASEEEQDETEDRNLFRFGHDNSGSKKRNKEEKAEAVH